MKREASYEGSSLSNLQILLCNAMLQTVTSIYVMQRILLRTRTYVMSYFDRGFRPTQRYAYYASICL